MHQIKIKYYPIFLMIASCLFFSILSGVIKFIGDSIHPFEQAFFRTFFCIFLFLPYIIFNYKKILKTNRKTFLLIRSFFGALTMILLFWSYTLIPLTQAISISFTTPLFIFLGSIIFFKERPTNKVILCLIVGFLLTIVIIQPESGINFGTFIALLASFSHAIVGLMVKDLTKTESVSSIMIFMIIFITPLTLIPASFVWTIPESNSLWVLLFSLAIIGTIGNFCWTRAISISSMTNIMPFDFSKLIFTTIIGVCFFNEVINFTILFGGLGLIICNIVVAKDLNDKNKI